MMKPAFFTCLCIVMFSGLLSFAVFMNELSVLQDLQARTTQRDFRFILITSVMQSLTITFYFVMGTLWGYLVGTVDRKYQLANQACNRGDYGTMASEA